MDGRAYEEGFGRLRFWSFAAYFFAFQSYWMAWMTSSSIFRFNLIAERQSTANVAMGWIAMLVGLMCLAVPMTAVTLFKYRAKVKQLSVLENQRAWCKVSYWMIFIGGTAICIGVLFNLYTWWFSLLGLVTSMFGVLAMLLAITAMYLAPRQLRHDMKLIRVLIAKWDM